ncbi:putative cytochrome P450 [Annulohypoxylon maeteangense]|uniref:putative cytochrome P450 n=1 Tax=Annulohypoxylon maeteangense TaxID=1927788 RepID=UPI002007CD8D|nr:putative cytochrome P450 [Annulohypoxylon maeteangense]KAI0885103.1 putative cytochrome P450 [Annulohypoxylon maeteangense]
MEVLGGIQSYQLVAIAAGLTLLRYVYTVLSSPLAKVPGPWYTKWTIAVFRYQLIRGKRPQWVHRLHEKYGPIVRVSPIEVSIQDPKAAQQIYSVKNEFRKSTWYQDLLPGLPNVFSTLDIDYHRRHRRLLASEISDSGLAVHIPTVDSKVRLTVERMSEEMEERGVIDVYRWAMYMATDVIGELSFGSSFRMLETKEETDYIRDLKLIGFAGGLRATFPFLTFLSNYIWVPVISVGLKVRNKIRDYATESLGRHYKLVEEQGDDAKPTLLSKLYRATENDTDTLPFIELREDAMAYIAAGSDTTTNTLTYLLWSVSRDPEVKAKLLAEIQTLPDNFEDADVRKLSYVEKVIQETLRLYSAVPAGLPRIVPAEGATLAGYFIPGGYTVSVQAYSMHRNPEVFPDPWKFNPSRWDHPTKAMKDSFLPFGGGSRICIGLHLAKMELRLMTARFFTRFPNARPSKLEGFTDEDMGPKMFFIMQPKSQRCLIEGY